MILVVTSFAASLAYTQFLLQRIDARALAISEDAVPGFKHISALRRELLRSQLLISQYVGRGTSETRSVRAQIAATHADVLAELAAYRSLPTSSEELQLTRSIASDIGVLYAYATQALDEADASSRAAALTTLSDAVEPALLRTDQTLEQLSNLNELQARASTEHILRVRRHALGVAAGLGFLSLGIASGATALVLRIMRTRAQLIEEHNRLLSERSRELEAFAGRVAHDLKEPLHAAMLRVLTLKTRDLGAQLHSDADAMGRQLERMRKVIDGLLEFALSGARPNPDARAELAPVLEEVVASLRAAALEAPAELHVGPFPAAQLACTPAALNSVLSNLLSNAIKYVREGEQRPHQITVRAGLRPATARIEISDNGPGLPPGYEQSIFRPFVRLRTGQPGTGLGLATVKRIVEAYGGDIGVISELGKGSTFWVELPRAAGPEGALASPSSSGRS